MIDGTMTSFRLIVATIMCGAMVIIALPIIAVIFLICKIYEALPMNRQKAL